MANPPNVDDLRTWIRVDTTDFDSMLSALLDTGMALAKEQAYTDFDDVTLFPDGWPAPVVTYVYAVAAGWYANPQSMTERQVNTNPFIGGLLDPYRRFSDATPTP